MDCFIATLNTSMNMIKMQKYRNNSFKMRVDKQLFTFALLFFLKSKIATKML